MPLQWQAWWLQQLPCHFGRVGIQWCHWSWLCQCALCLWVCLQASCTLSCCRCCCAPQPYKWRKCICGSRWLCVPLSSTLPQPHGGADFTINQAWNKGKIILFFACDICYKILKLLKFVYHFSVCSDILLRSFKAVATKKASISPC